VKQCTTCSAEKPLDDFYKCKSLPGGLHHLCKDCMKKKALARRLANPERTREYDRKYSTTPARKAALARSAKRYQVTFPSRVRANASVKNALKTGALKRQPCWVCGCAAVAHHPDYDRPLDVVWLCDAHHKQTHALARVLTP
jgi:hypothetical protein